MRFFLLVFILTEVSSGRSFVLSPGTWGHVSQEASLLERSRNRRHDFLLSSLLLKS